MPATVRSCGLMTQSWIVRSSVSFSIRCSRGSDGDIDSFGSHDVVKDLAQPGRDRSHRRPLDAGGQFDRRQPFVDQLPGEVDVGAVLERDDDLRQPELGDRTQFLQVGQPADRPARSET